MKSLLIVDDESLCLILKGEPSEGPVTNSPLTPFKESARQEGAKK